ELLHPLPALHLRMDHRLREGHEEQALDEVADRAHGLDAGPAEVAGGRRHDGALLGPRVWTGRVPVPRAADTHEIAEAAARDACDPRQRAFRVPGQLGAAT